jgi:solute carrier family 25 (mitochondrial folate transporter), member 32
MSHEQDASQAGQPSSEDHYAPSNRKSTRSNSPMSSSADSSMHTTHRAEGPTRLQRWAATAPDSQFNAISGAIGGFTSGIVTCPLDVIKTKLQAQGGYTPIDKGRHAGHPKMYNGLIGTGKVIWREEGIRGMYRGLGPIVMGYLPTWAVWFTVYNEAKVVIGQYHRTQDFLHPCSI